VKDASSEQNTHCVTSPVASAAHACINHANSALSNQGNENAAARSRYNWDIYLSRICVHCQRMGPREKAHGATLGAREGSLSRTGGFRAVYRLGPVSLEHTRACQPKREAGARRCARDWDEHGLEGSRHVDCDFAGYGHGCARVLRHAHRFATFWVQGSELIAVTLPRDGDGRALSR